MCDACVAVTLPMVELESLLQVRTSHVHPDVTNFVNSDVETFPFHCNILPTIILPMNLDKPCPLPNAPSSNRILHTICQRRSLVYTVGHIPCFCQMSVNCLQKNTVCV
jgi:hypothetical protein